MVVWASTHGMSPSQIHSPRSHVLTAQIYLVGSFMVYTLFLIHMVDSKPSPTIAHFVSWLVALIMEIILLGASFALYTTDHREGKVGHPHGGELQREMTEWEITEVTIDLVRIFLLIGMIFFQQDPAFDIRYPDPEKLIHVVGVNT